MEAAIYVETSAHGCRQLTARFFATFYVSHRTHSYIQDINQSTQNNTTKHKSQNTIHHTHQTPTCFLPKSVGICVCYGLCFMICVLLRFIEFFLLGYILRVRNRVYKSHQLRLVLSHVITVHTFTTYLRK
jgi:hypothetical protein